MAGDIDRLIEEGLARYGKGELDEALVAWELALQIDPDNAQASSYVDYVRMNYELLVDGQGPIVGNDGAPFVGDDDYQVEIEPGELIPAAIVMPVYDSVDEGWALDDEAPGAPVASRTISADPPQIILELDAEPPPDGIGFDDATREYYKGRPPTRDLTLSSEQINPSDDVNEFAHEHHTPAFGAPSDVHTPTGFGQQLTGVRKRDLGFVKPAAPAPAPVAASETNQKSTTIPGMTPIAPIVPARPKRASAVPELKMTLRTPEILHEDGDITIDRGIRNSNALDLLDELPASPPHKPLVMDDMARLDLVSSLPTKARTTSSIERAIADAEPDISFEPSEPEVDLAPTTPLPTPSPEPAAVVPTPAPPVVVRAPEPMPELIPPSVAVKAAAQALADLEVDEPDPEQMFGSDVETKDLPAGAMREIAMELGAAGRADTRELPRPERLPASKSTPPANLLSMPTRDLGLRPVRLPTEEESTAQLEIPRPPVVRRTERARPTQPPEVAPTDLIDTTSQLIMQAVDRDAPPDELHDDRTRRRIQGLLERASQWVSTGEPDKAVTAIDLALAEDATSPLAQKLIHRNQNAIMGIFQTYLGDLQRQPTLARPLHELATAPISPRAAFLLSRIDGMLSLDEILDVSGMPRLEAYRYLCQLFLRGILK